MQQSACVAKSRSLKERHPDAGRIVPKALAGSTRGNDVLTPPPPGKVPVCGADNLLAGI